MAEQLARRSDSIATFSAHLTHELKSPLTSIRGAAELLQDALRDKASELSAAEQAIFIANIISDTERLEAMALRLRELARAESLPQNERCELGSLIVGLAHQFPNIRITRDGNLDREVAMSAEKAQIVLTHLTDNAIRHHAGSITFTAVDDAAPLRLTVSNDGDAISPANRAKIFDAFFTTRRDAGGTGMGLAIVRAVMESHGGTIALLPDTPDTNGVTFELEFPAT